MAHKSRSNSEVHYRIKIIDSRNICHYCGRLTSGFDHIPPLSKYHDSTIRISDNVEYIKIPSCDECNILGGAELHINFMERFNFIKSKLANKYKNKLNMPAWTDYELNEIGDELKCMIKLDLEIKKIIQERIAYSPYTKLV